MTNQSDKPTAHVIKFSVLKTPLPTDPPGANDFYHQLGILMVAWGRLEGHFTLTLLNLMRLAGAQEVSHKLPAQWESRKKLWERALKVIPSLAYLELDASKLLDEIIDTAQDRNLLVHGMWGEFQKDIPVKIEVASIKYQKSTPDGLLFGRHDITVDILKTITGRINDHNKLLHPISVVIASIESTPQDAQII
ncbi:hypothetical protein V8G57_09100 [Collimonas sp. H4R21]|uniref:Uncharacterized protein n=1 Tax=Collimonas rhizosphaerae TaxID=3126357 RepID=A0ABU9PU95_9BURK